MTNELEDMTKVELLEHDGFPGENKMSRFYESIMSSLEESTKYNSGQDGEVYDTVVSEGAGIVILEMDSTLAEYIESTTENILQEAENTYEFRDHGKDFGVVMAKALYDHAEDLINEQEGYVVLDQDFGESMTPETEDESAGPLIEAGEEYFDRDYVTTPSGFDYTIRGVRELVNDVEN